MGKDFKDRIKIDETALDLEWLGQADLYLEVSTSLVEARSAVDILTLKLDVALANTDTKVRKNPGDYGIEKVTETAVKSAVAGDPEVITLQEELIEAKKEVGLLGAATTAIEHRKRALENLVTLHGQQYFAGPSAPMDLSRDWDKRSARVRGRKRKTRETVTDDA